jgi:hypothetical protein
MIWDASVFGRRRERPRHIDQQSHHFQCVAKRVLKLQFVKALAAQQLARTFEPFLIQDLEHRLIMS